MKVKLWCATHDSGSDASEIINVENDATDEELEALAEEFFWSEKEPEWGFNRISAQSAEGER